MTAVRQAALLLLCCAAVASAFSASRLPVRGARNRAGLVMQQRQPVSAPPGFRPPEPKPLTVTGDWLGMLSASAALALRCGAGLTVTGWRPVLSMEAPEDGEYSLKLGPVHLSDTSAVTRGECPRPKGELILYEFDSSPYCRKVRDACTALDLEVLCKPCPGALPGGKFSDELFARTGRRTVPYLIDEGLGVEMFESDDIMNHLFANYGPPISESSCGPTAETVVGLESQVGAPKRKGASSLQSSVSKIMSAATTREKLNLIVASTLEKLEILAARARGEGASAVYLATVPWQVCLSNTPCERALPCSRETC